MRALLVALAAVLILLASAGPGTRAQDAPAPPAVGDEAPDFTLPDHDGQDVQLSSFRDTSAVLLAFYPADFSRGCTNEMRCLGRELKDLDALGVQVLGISKDAPSTHVQFRRVLGLKFPLLSDAELAVARRYGVHTPSTDGGFAARSVFLVDRDGKLRFVERDFAVPRTLDDTPLMAAIRALAPGHDVEAELADEPSPAREGKLLLHAFVTAVLDEDVDALDGLLHTAYARRPADDDDAAAKRREEHLDGWRRAFEAAEFERPATVEICRLGDARVLPRDDAAGEAVAACGTDARALAALLRPGDLFVCLHGPGFRSPDGTLLLGREITLAARRESNEEEENPWRIVEVVAR